MVTTGQKLVMQNPGVFQNSDLLTNSTSIDSLSPDSPVFPTMLRAPRAPWVSYHNIVGLTPTKSLFTKEKLTGDGFVEYTSAHMDDAVSEITVDSEHQLIHRHPQAILEVRRILLEHLQSVEAEYRVAQRLAQLKAQQGQAPVAMATPTTASPAVASPTVASPQEAPAVRTAQPALPRSGLR
jgi:hypothetical protein